MVDAAGEGTLYLSRLPEGKILVLEDTAAVIYRACLESDEASLVARVAAGVDVTEDEIAPHVTAFVSSLIEARVLLRSPS
jgi:hypothetical protein